MKFQRDCMECSKKQGLRIFRIAGAASDDRIASLRRDLDEVIDHASPDLTPAHLSLLAIRTAERHAGNAEPFCEIKQHHNELALSLFDDLNQLLAQSPNPLHTACLLSACGNIIDLGTQDSFDIHATMKKVLSEGFKVDHFDRFRTDLEKAASGADARLVYLCDNAGEIGFDRLFIETMLDHCPSLHVTAVVNGGPILNDATMEDARAVGLDRVVRVIDNGHDDLGTVLESAGDAFLAAYHSAHVIISKGQANYETLSGREENLYFILKAKCEVIAHSLGVSLYDAVMAHHSYVKETQRLAFG